MLWASTWFVCFVASLWLYWKTKSDVDRAVSAEAAKKDDAQRARQVSERKLGDLNKIQDSVKKELESARDAVSEELKAEHRAKVALDMEAAKLRKDLGDVKKQLEKAEKEAAGFKADNQRLSGAESEARTAAKRGVEEATAAAQSKVRGEMQAIVGQLRHELSNMESRAAEDRRVAVQKIEGLEGELKSAKNAAASEAEAKAAALKSLQGQQAQAGTAADKLRNAEAALGAAQRDRDAAATAKDAAEKKATAAGKAASEDVSAARAEASAARAQADQYRREAEQAMQAQAQAQADQSGMGAIISDTQAALNQALADAASAKKRAGVAAAEAEEARNAEAAARAQLQEATAAHQTQLQATVSTTGAALAARAELELKIKKLGDENTRLQKEAGAAASAPRSAPAAESTPDAAVATLQEDAKKREAKLMEVVMKAAADKKALQVAEAEIRTLRAAGGGGAPAPPPDRDGPSPPATSMSTQAIYEGIVSSVPKAVAKKKVSRAAKHEVAAALMR